MKRKSSRAAIS